MIANYPPQAIEINKNTGNASKRSSNIELLRCVAMMMIIVHHYCVNSGISEFLDFSNNTVNTLIVQFMAFGGKVGVNIFFLISGYFMISGKMKWEKVALLLLQIFFYNLIIRLCLWGIGGYEIPKINWLGIIPVIFSIPANFIASYLFVYILSPLINRGLNAITQNEFNYLIGVLLFYFTIEQTFLMQNTWHYLGWAFVMYSIGAYIRRFNVASISLPWHLLALLSVLLVWALILLLDLLEWRLSWGFLIFDANKLTMFLCSVCIFVSFLNIRMRYNKFINLLATTCFGILLIHANCDAMRTWLWRDLLDVPAQINNPWLLFHMIGSCALIFIICGAIEIVRKRYFELPVYNTFKKCWIFLSKNNSLKAFNISK